MRLSFRNPLKPWLTDNMDRNTAFTALVHSLQAELYGFAYWLCKSPSQAQDLLQESYIRAWKSLDNLRDRNSAKAWLLTIVRREFLRTFERKQLEIVDLESEILESGSPTHDDLNDETLVRHAMQKLEAKYRIPLVLQVIGGLSCAEIASELSISEAAVMTQVFRARAKLKALLSDDLTHAIDPSKNRDSVVATQGNKVVSLSTKQGKISP
jgi:RNA polymerase sigma-70 factor, ECF subfamily